MNRAMPMLTVSLYLVGDSLDPAIVTSVLNVEPTKEQKKGQEFITASGREFKAKTGSWALVVRMESATLEVQLTRLLNLLPASISALQIPGVDLAFLDVFVAVQGGPTGEGSCELNLPADLVRRIAGLGLEVKFTFTAGPD